MVKAVLDLLQRQESRLAEVEEVVNHWLALSVVGWGEAIGT